LIIHLFRIALFADSYGDDDGGGGGSSSGTVVRDVLSRDTRRRNTKATLLRLVRK